MCNSKLVTRIYLLLMWSSCIITGGVWLPSGFGKNQNRDDLHVRSQTLQSLLFLATGSNGKAWCMCKFANGGANIHNVHRHTHTHTHTHTQKCWVVGISLCTCCCEIAKRPGFICSSSMEGYNFRPCNTAKEKKAHTHTHHTHRDSFWAVNQFEE